MMVLCICLCLTHTLVSNLDTANKLIGYSPPRVHVKPDFLFLSLFRTLVNLVVRCDEGNIQHEYQNDVIKYGLNNYGIHSNRLVMR